MRWLRWFPWKQVVSRAARSRGLVDPVSVLSRLESLAQPLEVKEPLELLRAGMVMHARGLLNAGIIQNNLDWIWPYWVQRQYDPSDVSFVPRAFSLTHVNLTHRNWTAVGLPGLDQLPIVDPRGLLTPFWDGWSLDAWIVPDQGEPLIPSRLPTVDQQLDLAAGLAVVTRSESPGLRLRSTSEVVEGKSGPLCRLRLEARAGAPARLVVALRPCNPEGVSFVHEVLAAPDRREWRIDGRHRVLFSRAPVRLHFSDYRGGDVFLHLTERSEPAGVNCRVGMATVAAEYELGRGAEQTVEVQVPLVEHHAGADRRPPRRSWSEALRGACQLSVPDARVQALFQAALRTLILHAPGQVYAGPFTYKRFWFRDATAILHALACFGLDGSLGPALARFPERQRHSGFFHSQDNEWDSNGQVLWLLARVRQLTGQLPDGPWEAVIERGARWIVRKRLPDDLDAPYAGLLPAGFSAEHLGPNDFYYWDDFWSVAGLRAAAQLLPAHPSAPAFEQEAERLLAAIERSLERAASPGRSAMPASPHRRMDSGAVGSLVAGYPLDLLEPTDPRLLQTAEHLLEHCFVSGCFFQDLIHSGLNPYLTLHVAQVLLRAGDPRGSELFQRVSELASATHQWPEALHPATGGGCMGDGQHAWAAAEWLMFLRNAFVRETADGLVLASGVPAAWTESREPIRCGPLATPHGPVSLELQALERGLRVRWSGRWRGPPPPVEVRLPGRPPLRARGDQGELLLPGGSDP